MGAEPPPPPPPQHYSEKKKKVGAALSAGGGRRTEAGADDGRQGRGARLRLHGVAAAGGELAWALKSF